MQREKQIRERIMWLLFVLALGNVSAQNSCLTPYNTYGRCVPYDQCAFLQKLFAEYGLSLPDRYKLEVQRARCEGNTNSAKIHLCCDDNNSPNTRTVSPIPTTTSITTPTQLSTSDEYESNLNERGLNILRSLKCGSVGGERVSYGENADLFEFPWMALLRYDRSQQPFQCGGTLVTDKYVLTAAHCMVGIADRLIGVRLGEHDLSTDEDCIMVRNRRLCAPPVEDYNVARTIPHPDFSLARRVNDVALIQLDRTVQFKKHIKPICLPIYQRSAEIPSDQNFLIAGWGFTEGGTTSNILQKALVPYKSSRDCQRIYRTRITEQHLCAGGDGRSDTCKGDSGGPLFYLAPYNTSQRFVQYGIVSFGGAHCGNERTFPGIYANVRNLLPWITSNID